MFIKDQSSFESIVPAIMSKNVWGFDLETNGSDPHANKHIMMQLGRPGEVYSIDTRVVNIEPLREFFESPKYLKIGQMLKFDYKMLRGTSNIKLENVRDLFLAEHILECGLSSYASGKKSLDNILFNRLGVLLRDKKRLQESFLTHTGEFTAEQIEYGESDVVHLIDAYKKQCVDISKLGLEKTLILECQCLPVFGDMEYDGIVLDRDKWNDLLQYNIARQSEIESEISEMVAPFFEQNLFGENEKINLSSPPQVLKLLQKLRMTVDGELITKTDDRTLSKLLKYPVIRKIKEYRSYGVLANTFGQPYIDAVNIKTGCIHPDFFQIGADNGRPTSGRSKVNPLNIPRDPRFRSCIVGKDGEVVETDDYNACESRILASLSKDPKMISMFCSDKDYHIETAYEITGKRVDKSDPWREIAKAANHLMAYGGGVERLYEKVISRGYKFTREEAKSVVYKTKNTFQKATQFIKASGDAAASQGWIANANGRIRKFSIPEKGPDYEKRVAAIKREAGNFVISSVGADILKQSMIYIRNSGFNTKFVNAIYDEIVTRTDKNISPDFVIKKRELMKKAGEKFITEVPVVINGSVGDHWSK